MQGIITLVITRVAIATPTLTANKKADTLRKEVTGKVTGKEAVGVVGTRAVDKAVKAVKGEIADITKGARKARKAAGAGGAMAMGKMAAVKTLVVEKLVVRREELTMLIEEIEVTLTGTRGLNKDAIP